ncbi:PEP/pyruvate-binding domain-containing protein [Acerihabitans sp. KWT182]|uniref:PEP/pyruvate-binding domain-containing protein n=1 Tax=Acerihabitans sp. KWT182 TaxID=3157919 RepID=A0AAU7Q855_9GAMM
MLLFVPPAWQKICKKSFAGIYESVLNVRSVSDLQEAIFIVLKSFYSLRAIMEKRDANADAAVSAVNIIVQRMVNPDFSGVAFSCHPLSGHESLYVEYVPGLGEGLVSGEKESLQLQIDSEDPRHRQAWQQINGIINSARTLLNSHVDIEWAYQDGKVWLLQARPVTNYARVECDNTPRAFFWPLYGDLPVKLAETLPAYAIYFNQKRKPLIDIARLHQKTQPGAIILQANRYALEDFVLQQQLLDHFTGQYVVVDFSDAVRQLIVDKSTLVDQLTALMSEGRRLYTVVLRDFIKGECGLITRKVQTPQGIKLVAEVSPDGLMAMNRGTAISQILTLDNPQQKAGLTEDNISLLHRVTADALRALGDVQIEWVLSGGQLYALDYSAVTDTQLVFSANGRVMSQGYARGQVYLITETEEIESYSIAPSMSLTEVPDASVYGDLFSTMVQEMEKLPFPPIVLARRPYAALASLIPWVAGFIFEKGSLLSHLGILLREKKLPAVCDEQLFKQIKHGDIFVLDTNSTR